MRLPTARGTLGERVNRALSGAVRPRSIELPDERSDHDDALTLWTIHELHYRGFQGVDDRWEWAPALMDVRQALEEDLEARLRRRFADSGSDARLDDLGTVTDVTAEITALIKDADGPSLARHLQKHGSREHALQVLKQRSLYHLKEADPTSWVVPRLSARPKAALLEVQFDEYGGGDPKRLHHELFRRGLEDSGLCPDYGHYVDEALVPVLEQNNALSLLGLHRRLRGAALGHLAAFEATSAIPSRQLAQGLDRLDFPASMVAYYDEHVEADAVHEQIVLRDICQALVDEEPDQLHPVLFGAWTCLDLESRAGEAIFGLWDAA